MKKTFLGCTGLEVSRLCFGTIPFGGNGWRKDPIVAADEAGKVLRKAFEFGLNFWDAAEGYGSHPHIREGLKLVNRKDIVLSTKTTQVSYDGTKASLQNSLREIGTDYIDIFCLHYVRSPEELEKRKGALKALKQAKKAGLVKHIGVSTHWSSVVEEALKKQEIEVLMVKLNKLGRMDCPLSSMLKVAEKAYENGKGVVVMKMLAYGDLTVKEGLEYSLSLPFVHSACLGIRTLKELKEDVKIYNRILNSKRKQP
jgi:aryl-alcohol dehydrogenase-like predicted oxidoreductase